MRDPFTGSVVDEDDGFEMIKRDPRTLSRVNQKRYVRERIVHALSEHLKRDLRDVAPWVVELRLAGILDLIDEEGQRMLRRMRSVL